MKKSVKIQLNESEFRKLVKEELYLESVRRHLLNEGYEPEVIEELLGGALKKMGSEVWGGAKKLAGQASDAVKSTAKDVQKGVKDTLKDVGDKAGEKVNRVKDKVVSSFQEKYRESLKDELEQMVNTLERKYMNEKVLKRAGLNSESVKESFSAAKETFWNAFIESLTSGMHQ